MPVGDPTRKTGGHPKSNVLLLVGVVGILGGLALLVYGLAPAKDLWDAVGPTFSGGPPPEDLAERMDASMDALKARVVVDALGFVALMVGVVLAKMAFASPRPKPVEQLVQEEVERRLAAQNAPPAAMGSRDSFAVTAQPLANPTRSTPAAAVPMQPAASPTPVRAPAPPAPPPLATTPLPAAAPAPRRTHCLSCGSVLVAGGRICPHGHAQA